MYKLKDLSGEGAKERYVYKSKEEVKRHLYDYHSQDTELPSYDECTLEYLLGVGGWGLITASTKEMKRKNHVQKTYAPKSRGHSRKWYKLNFPNLFGDGKNAVKTKLNK